MLRVTRFFIAYFIIEYVFTARSRLVGCSDHAKRDLHLLQLTRRDLFQNKFLQALSPDKPLGRADEGVVEEIFLLQGEGGPFELETVFLVRVNRPD